MGILDPIYVKFKDPVLNDRLFPIFRDKGTVKAVYEFCQAEEIDISKPTLAKMAGHFGWQGERDALVKSQFAPAADEGADLDQLLTELGKLKKDVHKALEAAPLDYQLHRVYGVYIGQILEVRKTIIAAQAVDKDQLLIDALKGTVDQLLKTGNKEAAAAVADNLEIIVEAIKEKWHSEKK